MRAQFSHLARTVFATVRKRVVASFFPNVHVQQRMEKMFGKGYDSGDIERGLDDPLVLREFKNTGANYKVIFDELIKPRLGPGRVVLEIGPGKGTWTRAVLNHLPAGTLHVVDRLPLETILRARCPDAENRLRVHHTTTNDYGFLADRSVHLAFSFGVFVHVPVREIALILQRLRPKMAPAGEVILQYSNWDKLDAWGWERARVPTWFRQQPSHPDVWWTPNDCRTMERISLRAGFDIRSLDLGYIGTCSVLHLSA